MITVHGQNVNVVPAIKPGRAQGKWRVRWSVEGRDFERVLSPRKTAQTFHAKLVGATASELFDVRSGLPASLNGRPAQADRLTVVEWAITWFVEQHARMEAGSGWAPKTATTHLQSLQTILPALVPEPATGELLEDCRAWIHAQDPDWSNEPTPAQERAGAWLLANGFYLDEVDDSIIEEFVLPAIRTKRPKQVKVGESQGPDEAASAGTIRIRRATLRALLGDAEQRGLIDRIPKLNPGRQGKAKAPAPVSPIDERSIPSALAYVDWIEAIATSTVGRGRLRAFYLFTLYTGARPSEVNGLRVEDLDLTNPEGAIAVLSRSVKEVRRGNRSIIVEGPLKHRRRGHSRTIPLPPVLVAALKIHLTAYPPVDGFVFRGATGALLSSNSHRLYSVGAEAMGWDDPTHPLHGVTHYSGRHVFITTMINSGMEIATIASLCGNSVDVIRRRYEGVIDKGRAVLSDHIQAAMTALP